MNAWTSTQQEAWSYFASDIAKSTARECKEIGPQVNSRKDTPIEGLGHAVKPQTDSAWRERMDLTANYRQCHPVNSDGQGVIS